MINKYYLSIEIRYFYRVSDTENPEDFERVNKTSHFDSHLFDSKKDCVEYGNKIIGENQWIEQYPGHIGRRLTERFDLIAPSLKNGAHIFIKVNTLNVCDTDTLNFELRKFNVPKINKEL